MDEIREKFAYLFDENENEYVFDFELLNFIEENIFPNGMVNNRLKPLYRYSPADYYNIRGLETRKIHLSEIGRMNDVFEGLPSEITDDELKSIGKIYDLAYIKSFSENCNDLLMWSRYADEYAGMCVEYDIRKLGKNVLCHLYPINYSVKRLTKGNLHFSFKELTGMKQNLENCLCIDDCDFLKDVMALFISKSIAWQSEKEWRLIFTYLQLNATFEDVEDENEPSEKILYDFCSKDIEFDCATRVFLGPRMEELKKAHIRDICKNLGIEAIELQLSKDKYQLDPLLKR